VIRDEEEASKPTVEKTARNRVKKCRKWRMGEREQNMVIGRVLRLKSPLAALLE
jgi:hypothetical protein